MANNGVRYERYNFNATEDDYLVSKILLSLQSLIRQSDPSSQLTWAIRRRRSALNSPPSPPPRVTHSPPPQQKKQVKNRLVVDSKNKERVHSPSSPLGYSPNEAAPHDNINHSKHHSNRKSKKRKLNDWEDHVEKLKQTKEQLILTLDNVKKYQRTVLEFNIKLKAKRDELNGHIPKQSKVETHQLHHQFPIFAPHKQHEYTMQPSMTLYYPTPFFPAINGGGMRIIDGYSRLDDKLLRAADARKRRRLQINEKKNSIGIRRLN